MVTADQHVWISDGVSNKFLKYDLNGKLLYSWGTYGQFPGGLFDPHQFNVDQEGNLYVADYLNQKAQRFRPKKGADPAKLIGPPLGGARTSN